MSFDFSDLVVQDDGSEFYNYDNFLSDPIYDWLQEPDNVLNACNAIEEEQQKQSLKDAQIPEISKDKSDEILTQKKKYKELKNQEKTI